MIIKADGNVGRGAPNPVSNLQVQGSGIVESDPQRSEMMQNSKN